MAPAYDQSDITALAGATIALEMLYLQAAKKAETGFTTVKTKDPQCGSFCIQKLFSSRISVNPARRQK